MMGNNFTRLAGEMFPCCKLDVASDLARKWRCRLDATWTVLVMSKLFLGDCYCILPKSKEKGQIFVVYNSSLF